MLKRFFLYFYPINLIAKEVIHWLKGPKMWLIPYLDEPMLNIT